MNAFEAYQFLVRLFDAAFLFVGVELGDFVAGDAARGITVVNAHGPQTRDRYSLLEKINKAHHFLPSVAARGQAKISDHYQFAEKGVSAIYIYTNGAKPWYHDTKDKPKELGFEQVDGLLALLKDFVKQL